MANPMQFSEELLKAAAQLEIRARRKVSALLTGNFRSAFRGSGMQFKEFRHYEPGDDIRHMSWQVTARTRRATIKTYEEEREIDVVLVVDTSGSSIFGAQGKRKIDMYAEIVALIGLSAVRSGDNLGLLLFSDSPGLFLPPKRTRNQVPVAVASLLAAKLSGEKSDLARVLPYLQSVLKNRSLIFVISDFLLPEFETWLTPVAKRHELVLIQGYDEAERGRGLSGVHEVCDPETGQFFVLDTQSERTKRRLLESHLKHSRRLEQTAKNAKADFLSLSVQDGDYLQKLVYFFKQRGPSRL
jgi:uncharacterized protein (DUF58 family)